MIIKDREVNMGRSKSLMALELLNVFSTFKKPVLNIRNSWESGLRIRFHCVSPRDPHGTCVGSGLRRGVIVKESEIHDRQNRGYYAINDSPFPRLRNNREHRTALSTLHPSAEDQRALWPLMEYCSVQVIARGKLDQAIDWPLKWSRKIKDGICKTTRSSGSERRLKASETWTCLAARDSPRRFKFPTKGCFSLSMH